MSGRNILTTHLLMIPRWICETHVSQAVLASCRNGNKSLDYFTESKSKNLRKWQLDNFGMDLDYFPKSTKIGLRKYLRLKRDFLSESQIESDYWRNSRDKYIESFPFDRVKTDKFLQEVAGISLTDTFSAIHIRRGDYLEVASKIIQLGEYLNLISRITGLLHRNILIISDSSLQLSEKSALKNALKTDLNLIYLDDPKLDTLSIHCVMRMSDLLVTANSTFSFSAGLLGKENQIVFSPIEFHVGSGSEKYNRSFRSVGGFQVWPFS
jgi:hypothetical protein